MLLPKATFVKEVFDLYGDNGADMLLASLRNAHVQSEAQLPLLAEPVESILEFFELPKERDSSDFIRGFHDSGTVRQCYNGFASVELLASFIPGVTAHEYTHLAQYQHQPANEWLPNSAFKVAIKEGVACFGESIVLHGAAKPFLIHKKTDPVLQKSVQKLLVHSSSLPDGKEAWSGNVSKPRIHTIGSYIVGRIAEQENIGIVDLVKIGFDEYYSLTKELV